jgi:hypothetical protein
MKRKIWIGIHPGYEELIANRIAESRKKYSRADQRAELLWRNSKFREGFRELRKKVLTDGAQTMVDFGFFCDRWGISRKWPGGDLPTLRPFVKTAPDIIFHPLAVGLRGPSVDRGELCRLDTDQLDCLLIRVNPWTSRKDVEAAWGHIEKLKKAIFGYSDKEKGGFGPSLCWYDLHKQYRFSFLKIARLWIQFEAPYIKDEESLKITIREGVKRIGRYIDRITPLMEIVNIPHTPLGSRLLA